MKSAKNVINTAVEHAIKIVMRLLDEDVIFCTKPNEENINILVQQPIYPVNKTFFGDHLFIIEKLANVAKKFIIENEIFIKSIGTCLMLLKIKEE